MFCWNLKKFDATIGTVGFQFSATKSSLQVASDASWMAKVLKPRSLQSFNDAWSVHIGMDVRGVHQELGRDCKATRFIQHDEEVVNVVAMLVEEHVHLHRVPNLLLLFQRHCHRRFCQLTFLAFITLQLFGHSKHSGICISRSQCFHQSSVAWVATSTMKFQHRQGQSLKLLCCHSLESFSVDHDGLGTKDGIVSHVVAQHDFGRQAAHLWGVEASFPSHRATHRRIVTMTSITASLHRIENSLAIASQSPGLLVVAVDGFQIEHAAVEVVVHVVELVPKSSDFREFPTLVIGRPLPGNVATSVGIVLQNVVASLQKTSMSLASLHTFPPTIIGDLIEVLDRARRATWV